MNYEKQWYVKKPVKVEAYIWNKNGDHPLDGVDRNFEGKVVRYYRTPNMTGQTKCLKCDVIMHHHGWIDTLEGGHIVCPGDYIVTGVRGEFYPVKPYIFHETYDKIE